MQGAYGESISAGKMREVCGSGSFPAHEDLLWRIELVDVRRRITRHPWAVGGMRLPVWRQGDPDMPKTFLNQFPPRSSPFVDRIHFDGELVPEKRAERGGWACTTRSVHGGLRNALVGKLPDLVHVRMLLVSSQLTASRTCSSGPSQCLSRRRDEQQSHSVRRACGSGTLPGDATPDGPITWSFHDEVRLCE